MVVWKDRKINGEGAHLKKKVLAIQAIISKMFQVKNVLLKYHFSHLIILHKQSEQMRVVKGKNLNQKYLALANKQYLGWIFTSRKFHNFFDGLLCIWKNWNFFRFFCYYKNVHCCKWPNIEHTILAMCSHWI